MSSSGVSQPSEAAAGSRARGALAGISLEGRTFTSVSNSGSGEVDDNTVFSYHQNDDIVWATYEGGAVRFGTLTGKATADLALDFRYTHVNTAGEIMTGSCVSTPEMLADGRLKFHESWQWASGDMSSGKSIIEEVL